MESHLHIQTTFPTDTHVPLLEDGPHSSWELYRMAYNTAKHLVTPSFDGLRSPHYLPHVSFLSHQLQCAEQVIQEMQGRAILADEVGLGKTIEAGLILKEYMIRGLVKKVLILAPASLVNQWVQEMNSKFYIPAAAQRKAHVWNHDVVVSSIDTAKRSPHREIVLETDYDLVIIDEAHKLKNHKTKNYEFVRSLKKKYCLLLTATPVQNQLVDIFNLISILKPGHLGNYEEFTKRFGKDRKQLSNDEHLKELVRKVMVRNLRHETGIEWTERKVETVPIHFTEVEMEAYNYLSKITQMGSSFSNLTLLRELCSSREACFMSIKKMMENEELNPNRRTDLEEMVQRLQRMPHHAKAQKVVELLEAKPGEKFIIFTEYRASQFYLQWYLQQHGITSVPFRGGFKRGKKDWMKQLFQNHAQVLIATEAGGEGINLQFCSNMINYDLPWNPMRLEQRIGRIHRFGQQSDVHIYNFALQGTIEEHVLTLLYEKIQLFERVVGNLDSILEKLGIDDLGEEIEEIMDSSMSVGEMRIKLDNLTSVMEDAKDHQREKEA
ncbi:ATP-dependent helicase [Pontibacillus halophilus JSM 076056 = DSM 19796]|uniref:ATP-dependent helicase n=1 Tax=Pontibacillus halophilus JSM 076056 = DSM 19796 TaxID=1385510 RepID=A0A0A5GI41_9BACI|nr:SNF2-related protein [Pontibacillus halophilus]KGX90883.1 ATP-dependent helicase [Pontibacillus halophilus JSM 076056 = DSM 19796]